MSEEKTTGGFFIDDRQIPVELSFKPKKNDEKIRWESRDGTMHEQDAPLSQHYLFQAPNPIAMDEQRIRALIREELHRALYPTAGLVNGHEHRRIEMTEESGKKWRGVLYLVEDEQ